MENTIDDDSQEMLSFFWMLRSWLLDCTAHGLPKIISSPNFNRKIFWIIAVFISAMGFFYQITTMFIDVYSHPLTVNLQIKHQTRLDFPTVTICNSNKFKASLISAHDPNSDLYKMVTFENFNSIGLEDIYGELLEVSALASSSADDLDTDNSTSKFAVTESPTSPEISRCIYEAEVGNNTTESENGFSCANQMCVPQTYMCDNWSDCSDNSDESSQLCETCPFEEFACKRGGCIDPKLRCNGVFDCPDGSDEDDEFCDKNRTQNVFLCCTTPRKIPLSQVCDGFDDCPREKSDEFLDICPDRGHSNDTDPDLMQCPRIGTSYWREDFIWISSRQLNDGVEDCLLAMDEICGWKNNLDSWVSPREKADFKEYLQMMSSPSIMRWYTMAPEDTVSILGHKYEDLVVKCTFNNKPCNNSVSIAQTVSQDYGNCFSFVQPNPVSTSGQTYGLNVWFNLEVYNTMGLFTPESGLKLYVTSPGRLDGAGNVFVDQASEVNLAPGFKHLIAVHPREIHKLPEPFSDCQNYREGQLKNFNTRLDCQNQCIQKEKAERCGCVDDLSFAQSDLCALNQTEQKMCVDDINENFNPNSECACPNECAWKGYDVTVTQLEWPTNRSIARFVADVYRDLNNQSAIDYILTAVAKYRDDKVSNTQNAANQLKSSFGSFTVYFRDLSETIILERPVYNFVSIVSNFGGLLGLYLGFSALTVLELVDFAFDISEYIKMRGKKSAFEMYLAQLKRNDSEGLRSQSENTQCTDVSDLNSQN